MLYKYMLAAALVACIVAPLWAMACCNGGGGAPGIPGVPVRPGCMAV